MFYLYKTTTRARLLARTLRVSSSFPYSGRRIDRRQSMRVDVNWGIVQNNHLPQNRDVLNRDLSIAISKVATFRALGDSVRHPPIFESVDEAKRWQHGYLARRDGLSAGRGITVVLSGQDVPEGTRYDFLVGVVPCRAEYRIHVGRHSSSDPYQIIATQQKIGVRAATSIIHNHDNGVTFSLQDLNMSERGRAKANEIAIQAVSLCGLDFGAVDLMQGTDNRLYVLEVNTAPGVRTDTLFNAYLEFFRGLVE